MFFKVQKRLKQSLDDYISLINQHVEGFVEVMMSVSEKGICQEVIQDINKEHSIESNADDIRLEIETIMYENSLLPDARGDILELIEAIDRVAGAIERLMFYIRSRKIRFPETICPLMIELTQTAAESARKVLIAFGLLLTEPKKVKDINVEIDKLESKCDSIEMKVIEKIFELEIDEMYKERLAIVAESLSHIADICESVGNRAAIAATKRIV